MHPFLGSLHMESGKYEDAIQAFERARVKLGDRMCQPPLIVSLVYIKFPATFQRTEVDPDF